MAIERELKDLANRFLVEKGNLENELRTAVKNNEQNQQRVLMLTEEIKRTNSFGEEKNHELLTLRE